MPAINFKTHLKKIRKIRISNNILNRFLQLIVSEINIAFIQTLTERNRFKDWELCWVSKISKLLTTIVVILKLTEQNRILIMIDLNLIQMLWLFYSKIHGIEWYCDYFEYQFNSLCEWRFDKINCYEILALNCF